MGRAKAAEPESPACTCLEDFPPPADALAFGCEHGQHHRNDDGEWAEGPAPAPAED